MAVKKAKKGPGRPLGSPIQRGPLRGRLGAGLRGCMFQVRLSISERALIRAAARRVGLTISAWARMTLLAASKGRRT